MMIAWKVLSSRGSGRSRRTTPPSASAISSSSARLRVRQLDGGLGRHLALENAPDGDEVVEKRHVVVVGQRDLEHDGVEKIPRAARLHGRPPPLLDPHEAALLEQLQPLAHDRPAEAELLAERRLGRENVALGVRCRR